MKKPILKLTLLITTALITTLNVNQLFSAEFVQLDKQMLMSAKANLHGNASSEATKKAYQELLKNADALLEIENFSVTNKKIAPPTNNFNDYLSISRYWWPDESKEDGLPWLRRDGETNPDTQTDKVDRKRLGAMTSAVKSLSMPTFFRMMINTQKKARN